MKKKNGIITTMMVLCSMAFLWAGCSSQNSCCEVCDTTCCETVCSAPAECTQAAACEVATSCDYSNLSGVNCCDQNIVAANMNGCATGGCAAIPEGCNPCNPCKNPCGSTCLPGCGPCPKPCVPLDRGVNKDGVSTSYIDNCGVRVTTRQPQLCTQGDNYLMDVEVLACRDVCEVEVTAMLPEGVSLVRSDPQGVITNGQQISWKINGMRKGECQTTRLTLRADREGNLCVCFCVTAVPVNFCAVLCAKPVLTCDKCGPCEVSPGCPVWYTITVCNQGSCAADDVVVTDHVPPELEHSSGLRTLTFKLGTIEACCSKKINVCFTACKRGKACNNVTVTACNAYPTSCQACTNIVECMCEVTKKGPKELPIGKNATYEITVTNPGDKTLTCVNVCDCAPVVTSIVEAKGAQVSGNQAVWRFQELKPGEKQVLYITLYSCTPGYYVNRVNVNNSEGCCCSAEEGTRWIGHPAINLQIVGTENPICVGESTSYYVRLINQGTEEDTNVSVVLRLPSGVMPTSAGGPVKGTISGQTVTFAPLPVVGPRQTLEFRVDAVARSSGDARVKVEVTSDNIKTPITQEESTIVN